MIMIRKRREKKEDDGQFVILIIVVMCGQEHKCLETDMRALLRHRNAHSDIVSSFSSIRQ